MMDQLVARLVEKVGVTPEQAEKAVEIILGFLKQAGPEDKVSQLFDQMPGAAEKAADTDGMMGGGMMAAMGAMGKMQAAGLGMGEVQSVTKEVVTFARENTDAQLVDDILGEIPGISQFT